MLAELRRGLRSPEQRGELQLTGAHMQKNNEYRTPAHNYFVPTRRSDTLNMKKFFYILDMQRFAIREGVFSWKKS